MSSETKNACETQQNAEWSPWTAWSCAPNIAPPGGSVPRARTRHCIENCNGTCPVGPTEQKLPQTCFPCKPDGWAATAPRLWRSPTCLATCDAGSAACPITAVVPGGSADTAACTGSSCPPAVPAALAVVQHRGGMLVVHLDQTLSGVETAQLHMYALPNDTALARNLTAAMPPAATPLLWTPADGPLPGLVNISNLTIGSTFLFELHLSNAHGQARAFSAPTTAVLEPPSPSSSGSISGTAVIVAVVVVLAVLVLVFALILHRRKSGSHELVGGGGREGEGEARHTALPLHHVFVVFVALIEAGRRFV